MDQNESRAANNYDYDEIDLRDIIKTLGKWKNTIIAVTLIFMLISGVYSFLIATPVYEAKAVVAPATISPLGFSGNLTYVVTGQPSDDFSDRKKMLDNMDNIVRLTQIDYSRYKEIMTSDYVLAKTINELGLKNKSKEFNVESFKTNINVQLKKNGQVDTDIIEVTIQNPDAKLASQIANTLLKETSIYINEFNNENMNKLNKTLGIQLIAAQDDLGKAIGTLKQYQVQNDERTDSIKIQVEEKRLEGEVDRRQDIVDSFNSKILELKVQQALSESENRMVVLSAATVPEAPVKPNKMLNLEIAAVLGLMFSIFCVFLAEYLKSDDNK